MDQETVKNFNVVWLELAETSPDYVKSLHDNLNGSIYGTFETPIQLLEKLSKVELLLISSILGASISTDEASAMKGGIVIDSEEERLRDLKLTQLRCRQLFDIIDLRAEISYDSLLDAIDNEKLEKNRCPTELPSLSDLNNYFVLKELFPNN